MRLKDRKRMSWAEILRNYPDQWLRLEDVEWEKDNDNSIVSAVVTRVGKPTAQDEFDAMDGKSVERFADSGRVFYVGGFTL